MFPAMIYFGDWRYWRYLESYLKSGCHGSCRQKMELAEWLVILIFKWKLRQFGETLRNIETNFGG